MRDNVRGIGRDLLKMIYDWCRERGLWRLEIKLYNHQTFSQLLQQGIHGKIYMNNILGKGWFDLPLKWGERGEDNDLPKTKIE